MAEGCVEVTPGSWAKHWAAVVQGSAENAAPGLQATVTRDHTVGDPGAPTEQSGILAEKPQPFS